MKVVLFIEHVVPSIDKILKRQIMTTGGIHLFV